MIEYENFIYLDVPKTGSTHVVDVLKKVTVGRAKQSNRHKPVRNFSKLFRRNRKFAFATVRNPWDWYVSMWAYGYTLENPLYQHILDTFGPEVHGRLYDKVNSKAAFAEWLASINDPAFINKVLKGHRLPWTGLTSFLGYYSYRFMKVTLPYPEIFLRQPFIRSMDGAIAFQRRWAMYDTVLRTETLDDDLCRLTEEHAETVAFRPRAARFIRRQAEQRRNVSDRTLSSYRDYYSEELRDLVARRDRMIVDLFGYTF